MLPPRPGAPSSRLASGADRAPRAVPHAVPAVSLVTTPVRTLATCVACGGHRVTAISMTLTDGSVVDFSSCHACEHKSWQQGGRDLDIATVLTKATKPRR